MSRSIFIFTILLLFTTMGYAQEDEKKVYKDPSFAIKTNALYWATTTPNLGIEFRLSDKFTLDISGGYNPWTFSDNKKFKHWLAQPELRYWYCRPFGGSFWGLHLHGAQFNVGGWDLPVFKTLKDHRYEGWLIGAGISYGYQWILSNRWSLEASIGVGYAYIDYDKYKCEECGEKIKSDTRNYWGPTKASLSLIYIIK